MSDFQDDELLSIAIVKQGAKVICGTQTGPLPIFSWGDFGDQKDRIKGHPMSVDAMVKLAEDGILTGSSDGKIRVVAVHSKGLGSGVLGLLGEHGSAEYPMERLALSGDEKLLASTAHSKPSVLLWSTEEARRLLAGETWAEIFGEEAAGIPAGEAENEEVDSSDEEERRLQVASGIRSSSRLRASSLVSESCRAALPAAAAADQEVPKLPERFLGFEDVVAKELGDLDYPWNLKAMEERIQEYSTISEVKVRAMMIMWSVTPPMLLIIIIIIIIIIIMIMINVIITTNTITISITITVTAIVIDIGLIAVTISIISIIATTIVVISIIIVIVTIIIIIIIIVIIIVIVISIITIIAIVIIMVAIFVIIAIIISSIVSFISVISVIAINAQLSARVMQNYNEFVTGMQMAGALAA
ncbi:WD repeat-containing protein 55-like [Symbiodinium microadriaticum]|uniref:WD repeat-containing protein 55-like n=1 Tax=Symbiodinium microadriaticum TaxID=2951 RepID=A0A1Q9D7V8_SYMMI|nr:WD repeat-containing protein 55-like [Symbiodinium microadriaticum]